MIVAQQLDFGSWVGKWILSNHAVSVTIDIRRFARSKNKDCGGCWTGDYWHYLSEFALKFESREEALAYLSAYRSQM